MILESILWPWKVFHGHGKYFMTMESIIWHWKVFHDLGKYFMTWECILRHWKVFQDFGKYSMTCKSILWHFKDFLTWESSRQGFESPSSSRSRCPPHTSPLQPHHQQHQCIAGISSTIIIITALWVKPLALSKVFENKTLWRFVKNSSNIFKMMQTY